MADALHTSGAVVQAVEARLDDGGLLTPLGPGAMDIRTGVMAGPGSTSIVTGTSATGQMTVQINPHHWVTSRGSASGPYRGAREAVTTVNIAAAPASGSRIDVVYVKQQTTESGVPSPDATTGELYGVLQGTSGTTPVKPSVSTIVGAEELATVTVAAGATATNGAGVTITSTARQTVARGGLLPCISSFRPANVWDGLQIVELDTGRIYVRVNGAWDFVNGPPLTWTPTLVDTNGNPVTAGGTARGTYTISGGRFRFSANFQFLDPINGRVGILALKLPTGVVARSSEPEQHTVHVDLFTPAVQRDWVGSGFAFVGGTTVGILFPRASNDCSMSLFQNATAAGATGTGVPAVAGSYPLTNGSRLGMSGEFELSSWPAL